MYSRFTLSAQFIVLLVATIIVSQTLNTLVLLTDRQIAIRSDRYGMLIDDLAAVARDLPSYDVYQLPLFIGRLSDGYGRIFLSEENQAELARDAVNVVSYQKKLSDSLSKLLGRDIDAVVIKRRLGRSNSNRRPSRPVNHRMARPSSRWRSTTPRRQEVVASAEIRPGVWLNASFPHYTAATFTTGALGATVLKYH